MVRKKGADNDSRPVSPAAEAGANPPGMMRAYDDSDNEPDAPNDTGAQAASSSSAPGNQVAVAVREEDRIPGGDPPLPGPELSPVAPEDVDSPRGEDNAIEVAQANSPRGEEQAIEGAQQAIVEVEDNGGRQSQGQRFMQRLPPMPKSIPQLPEGPALPKIPDFDLAGKLQRLPHVLCSLIEQYPWLFLAFAGVVYVVVISAAWRPVRINADLEEFRRVDRNASMYFDVYRESLNHKRASQDENSLAERLSLTLELVYEAKSGSVFSESGANSDAVLRDIRSFEHYLRGLSGWKQMCTDSDPRARFRCEPGESLGNYVWPERLDDFLGDNGYFRLNFDGSALERLPVPATLTYLGTSIPQNVPKFLPQGFAGPNSDAKLLRSLFTFTAPNLDADAFRQKYRSFVEDELFNELVQGVEKAQEIPKPDSWDEESRINIYFRGDVVDEFEVIQALEHDMKNASGALVVMFFISWFQFRSLFLAFATSVIMCLTVLFVYVIVPITELSLASFLAVFLAFGLGGNSLIYIQDIWRRSRRHLASKVNMVERLKLLYKQAILKFVPLFVTACSFYLFLIALLRPLREFGLFMGTLMICFIAAALAVFIPVLVLHEQWVYPLVHQKMKPKCGNVLATILEPHHLSLENLIARRLVNGLRLMHEHGKKILIGSGVVICLMFILAVVFAAVREGSRLPEIYSDVHHRTAGREMLEEFVAASPGDVPAPDSMTACEPGLSEQVAASSGCGLHWCDAPLSTSNTPIDFSNLSCPCFKEEVAPHSTKGCSNMSVKVLLSGLAKPETASAMTEQRMMISGYVNNSGILDGKVEMNWGSVPSKMSSLVLEHWLSGRTDIEPLLEWPLRNVQPEAPSITTCISQVVCHCGPRVCEKPPGTSWSDAPNLFNNASSRRLSEQQEDMELDTTEHGGRLLSSLTSSLSSFANSGSTESTTEVVILFGLEPPIDGSFFSGSVAWNDDRFDHKTFDPESPAAQRAMYAMCPDSAFPSELRVEEKNCWILDFRRWLYSHGQKFPVPRFKTFQEELDKFLLEHPEAAKYMWLDKNNRLRATSFHLKVKRREDHFEALKDQENWQKYVTERNDAAETPASRAWATSQAWANAEAYESAISSAWVTSVLIMCWLLLTGLCYTLDVELMALIVFICFALVIVLSFLMFCLCQWYFGPWEIILFTTFLSYTVEPAYRIAQDFVFPGLRNSPLLDNTLVSEGPLDAGDEGPAALADSPAPALADESRDGPLSPSSREGEAPEEPDIEEIQSTDSRKTPDGDEVHEALERSVYLGFTPLLVSCIQLFTCGLLLLPCEFRFFSRLGAVSIWVSFLWIPAVLIIMPIVIVFSGRTRREPDLFPAGRLILSKVAWLWS